MSEGITFDIRANNGVGPIRFGMTPMEVRSILGPKFVSFMRTPDSVHPCDHFTDIQCFVYYDLDGRVEAVEFAEPSAPTLNGVNLLNLGFADLIMHISSMDPDVSVDSDGFTSQNLGVGGWAPSGEEEPNAPPESIIVFGRGYYD